MSHGMRKRTRFGSRLLERDVIVRLLRCRRSLHPFICDFQDNPVVRSLFQHDSTDRDRLEGGPVLPKSQVL